MSSPNTQPVNDICDNIIRAFKVCLANKQVWKDDKREMLKKIQFDNPTFYELYPRISRIIAYESESIEPLIGMLKIFGKVQADEMSLDAANNLIGDSLNDIYVNPILKSEALTKERNEKIKAEADKKMEIIG